MVDISTIKSSKSNNFGYPEDFTLKFEVFRSSLRSDSESMERYLFGFLKANL